MADQDVTKNFFENPMQSGSGNTGWAAGGGALVGALLGNNGILGNGNREQAVTPDQLGVAVNGLRTQIQADQLEDRIAGTTAAVNGLGATVGLAVGGSTTALSAELGSIRDALTCSNGQLQLALCGLGNNIAQGFAATNFNIQSQAAQSRELALQQALDAERVRATELRIELSESRSRDLHHATQLHVTNSLTQVTNASAGTNAQVTAALAGIAQLLSQLTTSVAGINKAVA